MEKFKVTLTVEERKALEHLVSVGKAAARKLAHPPPSCSWLMRDPAGRGDPTET